MNTISNVLSLYNILNLCNVFKKLHVTILLYYNPYYMKKLIVGKKA